MMSVTITKRGMSRDLSNPLRCEHLFRVLSALEEPKTVTELLSAAKLSAGIYYNTIEKTILSLGLVEYEMKGRSILVKLTDNGRALLEVMKKIHFERIMEIE